MIPILIENLANKKKPNNNKLSTINNVKKKENYTQKYEINKKKQKTREFTAEIVMKTTMMMLTIQVKKQQYLQKGNNQQIKNDLLCLSTIHIYIYVYIYMCIYLQQNEVTSSSLFYFRQTCATSYYTVFATS